MIKLKNKINQENNKITIKKWEPNMVLILNEIKEWNEIKKIKK